MPIKTTVAERRRFGRSLWPGQLDVSLIQPQRLTPVDRVNVSEGGLCLRLPATLEVRSLVRLQVGSDAFSDSSRFLECSGRVAWVTQRLDLRSAPPYLFDVGIEFVNPPRALSRWLVEQSKSAAAAPAHSVASAKLLEAAVIRGRHFSPRLENGGARQLRWHLIVTVDGSPCFSQRYATQRAAMAGWAVFKRQQARASRTG